jgi:hypothetical protein
MSNRIRIARVSPIREVPYAIPGDAAGATGSPDTRSSNPLHTKQLPKRSFHTETLSYTKPLNPDHELYLEDMEPKSEVDY